VHARRSLPLALLALSLSACASLLPPRETGELVFWRVARADGAGGSVHLLGSLHLGREDFPFDPAITTALAGDEQLVLEVAPDELTPAAMQPLIRERGRLPAGRSLADELSPDTLAALEKRLAELGWPEEPWLHVKPWVVSLALAGDALSDSGFAPEHGVERSLSQSPAAGGKPVRGIETAREQIERLDALPPATQELLLRDLLRERHGRSSAARLQEAWQRGDLRTIERVIYEPLRGDDSAAFFEAIYWSRSRTMAEQIAGLVDGGGASFVAVGAGHVVGSRGVPALLLARGYRVERIPKTRPPKE